MKERQEGKRGKRVVLLLACHQWGSLIGIYRPDKSSSEEIQWGSLIGIYKSERSNTGTIECGSLIGI
ncbi:MAG: hypothetical protein LUQ27_00010 [Methanomassiliicoccales archaeon]|nr:hypothetical protein [Methanomassiliicoccales archaeon]